MRSIEFIGSGTSGIVYRISEQYAAKIIKTIFRGVLDISQEYKIARDLYDRGISVPRPIGVFDLDLPDGFVKKGFVYEYFPETAAEFLKRNPHHDGRIREIIQKELRKARGFGYIPSPDANMHKNILISGREPVLIDFGLWGKI